MEKINVYLKRMDRKYQIKISEKLNDFNIAETDYAVVTDKNVLKIFGSKIKKIFGNNIIAVPAGEKSKTLNYVENICRWMTRKGCGRNTIVVGVGGGVVGDIAGFVSSIFMRGIGYIQVPTTLLAMVDSSIGGKTGVNIKEGKNLIGSFHQPIQVLVSMEFLSRLPEKQFKAGMAEIIKYGIIKNGRFFKFLEKNADRIKNREKHVLSKIIKKSVLIKKEIVEKDEKEKGLRQILNYGHTLGHALEICSGLKLTHGEAVSVGICFANELSKLDKKDKERIKNVIEAFNLPSNVTVKASAQKLIGIIKHDKKVKSGRIYFVLLNRIGQAVIREIEEKEILKKLEEKQ